MNGEKKQANKKRLSAINRGIITIYQVTLFGIVWVTYYNLYAFRSHRLVGGALSILIFTLLYNSLGRLYRAFKVGAYPIGETVFSQVLSFGMADLLLYVECCLISNRYVNILVGCGAFALQILGTMFWAILAKHYYMKHVRPSKTLIIYGGDTVSQFEEKLEKKYQHIFHITDVVSSCLPIEQLLEQINAHETILLYEVCLGKRTDIMSYCINEKKTFYVTPRISDIIMEGFENRHMVDTPLMKYEYQYNTLGKSITKRTFDIVFSLLGIAVTIPIALITAIAIKLEDGGDIFFKQVRYTKDWKKFSILKFRSMVMDAEKGGEALLCKVGDARITKVGKVIRRFRVDEIPQLLNVLKGDMSIVGPRPERVENVEAYVQELPEFAYRLRVKGGLTGYAQIYGKYNTSAYDKLKLDLMYIENQNWLLDWRLVMLTFKVMFIPESTEGFTESKVETISFETVRDEELPMYKVN